MPLTNVSLVTLEDMKGGLVFQGTDSRFWMHYQAKGIESAGNIVLRGKKKPRKKSLGLFPDSTVTVNCIMRRL